MPIAVQPASAHLPLSQITSGPSRVLSIDVLRGLTIALMILVNDPGDWAHTYTQLDHAPWNGFTLTDFVFPNFLFLVGASIIFSLQSRLARGASKKTIALQILRRALLIFAIKMFLTAYPHFHYHNLRIYGVLTRIALCYLVAGLICLLTQRPRTLLIITATLLIGYWALMRFVPIPGLGVPTRNFPILDPNNNLAAWLDRVINAFTQHVLQTGRLYEHTRDPEGLLSTLPAIATTLVGSITAIWFRQVRSSEPADKARQPDPDIKKARHPERSEGPLYFVRSAAIITPARCLFGLLTSGTVTLALGLLWNPFFPINKNLWTSSYVLYSAGWSLLTLALCYWLIDIKRIPETRAGKWLTFPWLIFGSNAITAFVVSNFVVLTLIWIKVPDSLAPTSAGQPAKSVTAWFWAYHHLFARHASTNITSLAFALTFVALCLIPNWLLWRKHIFLKV